MKIQLGVRFICEYYVAGVCCQEMKKMLYEDMFYLEPKDGLFYDRCGQILKNCPYCNAKLKDILI